MDEAHEFAFSNTLLGFPGGLMVKNPPANAGEAGLIPGSGRSPGERNANPFQYSFLENPMDRGAWRVRVHEVAKELDITLKLNSDKITATIT